MRHSRFVTSRKQLAIAALAIGAILLSPLSGAGRNGRPHARPLQVTPLSASGQMYTFAPVGDKTQYDNYITGIDDEQVVVGVYHHTIFHSFKSQWASPDPNETFTPQDDSSYSTFLNGLDDSGYNDSNLIEVGYIVPQICLNWCTKTGVIFTNNVWTPIQDPHRGSGGCADTVVTAINDSRVGVGWYEKSGSGSTCITQAFEFYQVNGSYVYLDLSPLAPGNIHPASSTATGINNLGDIVGSETWGSVSSPNTDGWFYSDMVYNWFSNPNTSGAYNVTALGVNFEDDVVGDYVDNSGTTHGFVLNNPESSNSHYSAIDHPSTTYTVVQSINYHSCISGEWMGSGGTLHGFVGSWSGCTPKPPGPDRRGGTR